MGENIDDRNRFGLIWEVMMAQGTPIPLEGGLDSKARHQKLAAAVFRMALEDVRGPHSDNRRSALHFLLKDKSGFSFWCHRLEVDPEAFRKGLYNHVLGPYKGFAGLVSEL